MAKKTPLPRRSVEAALLDVKEVKKLRREIDRMQDYADRWETGH